MLFIGVRCHAVIEGSYEAVCTLGALINCQERGLEACLHKITIDASSDHMAFSLELTDKLGLVQIRTLPQGPLVQRLVF